MILLCLYFIFNILFSQWCFTVTKDPRINVSGKTAVCARCHVMFHCVSVKKNMSTLSFNSEGLLISSTS